MTKIFIGGSRRISRLNADIRQRLDRIIDGRFEVIVGDANGADKSVQTYFKTKSYNLVEVFCAGRTCRNNVGSWPTRMISADKLRGFDFYAAKDRVMAEEASHGLMIWDGKSVGTLMNVLRLLDRNKIVVIYVGPTKEFIDLKSNIDLRRFIDNYASELKPELEDRVDSELRIIDARSQLSML